MAREQFFLDQEEDTIHTNEIMPTTAKEKRDNWWYYHKTHVILAIIALVLAGATIYSITSRVEPDYTIALLGETSYSTDVMEQMQEELKPYAEDRNHDGKISIEICTYGIGQNKTDAQMQQMDQVRLAGDSANFESVIFLSDKFAFEWMQQQNSFFTYLDGSIPPKSAADYDNMRIPWAECKALTAMDLSTNMLNKEEAQKYMSPLFLSTRLLEGSPRENDEDAIRYYQDSRKLFERLIAGKKLTEEEQFSSAS